MNHGINSQKTTALALVLTTIIIAGFDICPQAKAQVNTNDIENGAVTSPKIRDREVKTSDIADGSITSDKIRNGAVGTAEIADNSITSNKIIDGSIMTEDLATDIRFTGDGQGEISQIIFNTCSIDFDAVAAQKVATAFCPVPGAQIGDPVVVTNQDLALGLLTQSASVNGTELVRIAVSNPNFNSIDPPSATWH